MINQIMEIKSACNQIHTAMHAISNEYKNQSISDGNTRPDAFQIKLVEINFANDILLRNRQHPLGCP